MSVVFVVAPAVIAGWPLICGAVAGAAGTLGYKILKSADRDLLDQAEDSSVEVQLAGSEVIADSMQRDSRFAITNGDITATFMRGADGSCSVHVAGKNRTQQELTEAGNQILGQITQQYAYNKVVTELKSQGFAITQEDVSADKSIRIRVSKYI